MMVHLAACCDSIFLLIICKLIEGLKFKYLILSLSLRNKSFIWNITVLRILTGSRRTSWLFHKRGYGYMSTGLPRTNPASGQGKGLEIGASRLQVPRPRFLLFLLKHILCIILFLQAYIEGYTKLLGISTYVRLNLTMSHIELLIQGNFLNLIKAELYLTAGYSLTGFSANFYVRVTVDLSGINKVRKSLKISCLQSKLKKNHSSFFPPRGGSLFVCRRNCSNL